MDLFFLFF